MQIYCVLSSVPVVHVVATLIYNILLELVYCERVLRVYIHLRTVLFDIQYI